MNKKQFFAIMMVVFGIIFIGITIMKYALSTETAEVVADDNSHIIDSREYGK